MKYEWKKEDFKLYLPKNEPETLLVPPLKFIMLDGKGDPNEPVFTEAVGVLYALAYGVKMLPKKGVVPSGYYDYTVFPLEGVWDLADEAKGMPSLDKSHLVYTIMIRQPEFVTEEVIQTAMMGIRRNKPHPLLEKVRFETAHEGLCLQMMHLGPYDTEPASFERMDEYCRNHQLKRCLNSHREIYVSDARKTAPEKLRTVLRYQVKRNNSD